MNPLPIILGLSLTACTLSGHIYIPSHPPQIRHYTYQVSPRILWGLAHAESDFDTYAISRDGHDKGMFQLRDTYNKLRNVKNPYDPVESARHASRILLDNLIECKTTVRALAAYRQGTNGVKKHGITKESYLYAVKIINFH